MTRKYVNEAESIHIADRPQFHKMIDAGGTITMPAASHFQPIATDGTLKEVIKYVLFFV